MTRVMRTVAPVPPSSLLILAFAAVIALVFGDAGIAPGAWWYVTVSVTLVMAVLPLPRLIRDFYPFLAVGFMFLTLAALRPWTESHAHPMQAADLDRAMVGTVVPVWMQQHWGGFLSAAAWPMVALYMAHYITPPLCGLWLWLRHRDRFEGFQVAYILCMSVGFVICVADPVIAPWAAAQDHLLPPLQRTVVQTLQGLGGYYAGADPEPMGAMPSLHVTVPLLCAFAIIRAGTTPKRWLWLLYPPLIGFALMLMAEHFLSDVIAGALLAVGGWGVVRSVEKLRGHVWLRGVEEAAAEAAA